MCEEEREEEEKESEWVKSIPVHVQLDIPCSNQLERAMDRGTNVSGSVGIQSLFLHRHQIGTEYTKNERFFPAFCPSSPPCPFTRVQSQFGSSFPHSSFSSFSFSSLSSSSNPSLPLTLPLHPTSNNDHHCSPTEAQHLPGRVQGQWIPRRRIRCIHGRP